MYIDCVPNRNSPPAILLRESYRLNGKVKKRTLANLSKCPPHVINGLRILLKGGIALRSAHDLWSIVRSFPHGHVAAVVRSHIISPMESRNKSSGEVSGCPGFSRQAKDCGTALR